MEVISTWTWRVKLFGEDGRTYAPQERTKCTARCVNDHWYAGDLEDLKG